MDWGILFYIIPIIIAVGSVVTIVVVYFKKLSQSAALDLDAMPQHRQQQRKANLVEDRLGRKLDAAKLRLKKILAPIGVGITKLLQAFFRRLKNTEEKYRQAAKAPAKAKAPGTTPQSVSGMLQEAEQLVKEEKYNEAEKIYISAIALDNTSVAAYRGLAQNYVQKKDREHAIETYNFLKQLNPKDENLWYDMGRLYKEEGDEDNALEAFEKAVEQNPKNPRNLDALIDAAIVTGLKYKAQTMVDKLKEVNPENKKLEDYQQRIEEL